MIASFVRVIEGRHRWRDADIADQFGDDSTWTSDEIDDLDGSLSVGRGRVEWLDESFDSFIIMKGSVAFVATDENGNPLRLDLRAPLAVAVSMAQRRATFGTISGTFNPRIRQVEELTSVDAAIGFILKNNGGVLIVYADDVRLWMRKRTASNALIVVVNPDTSLASIARSIEAGADDFCTRSAALSALRRSRRVSTKVRVSRGLDLLLGTASERLYVQTPFILSLAAFERRAYARNLQQAIRRYRPEQAIRVAAPKSLGSLRPVTILSLKDAVVYTAAVRSSYGPIRKSLLETGSRDYANELLPQPTRSRFFRASVRGWNKFTRYTAARLKDGKSWVLLADVSSFYANIDVAKLLGLLRQVGIPRDAHRILSAQLLTWAEPRGRGIPQGYSASDVLAKLYLCPIDAKLLALGIRYCRYSDDFRLFFASEADAREGAEQLQTCLWDWGLDLQQVKTRILPNEQARRELLAAGDAIAAIRRNVRTASEVSWSPYESKDVDEIIAELGSASGVDLEEEFAQRVPQSGADRTLQRFLLRQLGAVGSPVAVEWAVGSLKSHPEETPELLRYLARLKWPQTAVDAVCELLETRQPRFVTYQALRWLAARPKIYAEFYRDVAARIMLAARPFSGVSHPLWLRGFAYVLLADLGTTEDRRWLESRRRRAASSEESAILDCCLGAPRSPDASSDDSGEWTPLQAAAQVLGREAGLVWPPELAY